jgi:hypothetical protein
MPLTTSTKIDDIKYQSDDAIETEVFVSFNNAIDIVSFSNIEADLKIKAPNGDWQDTSVTGKAGGNGDILEFKVTITINRAYGLCGAAVFLPEIDGSPMFDYEEGSASPEPLEGSGDEKVSWAWGYRIPPYTKELTFKAKIKKVGTRTVELEASGVISIHEEDTAFDSVSVTGQGGGPCCFPAGTKITMADGSQKNIEDIRVGDRILSYDVKRDRFTSWTVKVLGNPIRPVYEINNGLIRATNDHPFYVKKTSDKKIGWGAIDNIGAKNANTLKGEILSLNIGDQLYTKDGNWVDIDNIRLYDESMQTYNILSFTGTKTYFANGFLVYEEHPPFCIIKYLFREIFDRLKSK